MSPADRDAGAAAAATITGMFAGAELVAGEVVAGRFRIEGLIGIGGMGVVYRAHDQQLGVDVALKLLRPELASRPEAFARFRQEILLARQVSSPHVVRIHDLVADGTRWLISMDFVPGASLEKLLDERGKLGFDDAMRITRQLALGLAAAHQRDVIHRDLKPANILVTDTLDAYVSDFGVARSAGATGVTGAGVVVGTPEYLSPEQARADTLDARSDLYALGLIVYEMLTGKLPFPEGTPAELLAQRIVRSPPPLSRDRPDAPAWIVRLVGRLLQLKPARRFQSAHDVVAAIDARRVAGALPGRSAWLAVATALGLIGGGVFVSQRETPVPEARDRPPRSTTPLPAPAPLLVLPLQPATPDDAVLASAISELLAESLLGDGVPSLDSARTTRLLRQLGYDAPAAERNAARVLEAGGATRALSGGLARDGGRYVMTLRRLEPRSPQPARETTSGKVTLDALPEAAMQVVDALGLRTPGAATRATPAWPRGEQALLAFGAGVLARAEYDEATALAAFGRAVEADPGFALAWRHRLDLLDRQRAPTFADAAGAARTAVRGATGRAADTVRAYAELADGDAAAAAARLAPLVAAAPDDHALALLRARALEDSGDDATARKERERVAAADPFNADAWLTLGRAAVRGGDAQRGVDEFLIRAQVLFTRQADPRGLADTANALGIGYERLGQLAAAAEHFGRAAQSRERLGDGVGAARARRNLAAVQMVRGELDAAAAELAQARQLLGTDGDLAARSGLANDEGLLAEERGDFRAALAAYREALELRQRAGDATLVVESLINVGFAYYHVGEFDNAATYFAQAGAAADAAGDVPSRVRAEQNLGLLATARGDWDRARTLLDASLATAEAQQMSEERSISLLYLADLDRLEGRLADALARVAEAEKLFVAREDSRAIVEARLVHATALIDVGAWDAAAAVLAPDAVGEPGSTEQAALLAVRRGEIALGREDVATATAEAATARAAVAAAHSVPAAIQAAALELRLTGARRRVEDARRGADALLALLKPFPAVALELAAREAALAATLDVRQYDGAVAVLERAPRYVGAWRIHAGGAAALRRAGRARDADTASATAATQRAALAATLPPDLATALDAAARNPEPVP